MTESKEANNETNIAGVPSSAQWTLRSAPPSGFSTNFHNIPPLWAHLTYTRGIRSPEELEVFTHPESQPLHDPFLIPDVDSAVTRLIQALTRSEVVAIFGDFDTDGISATALLCRALKNLNIPVLPYIPNRAEEGHGLNTQAMGELLDRGVTLLITVDCGVTSHQEIAWGNDHGLDVIITDHHAPGSTLPDAVAIVNTARSDSQYPFEHLTGVGTAFKLVQALYQNLGKECPETLLELVSLGTITDVAPLIGENRTILSRGLQLINTNPYPGLKALINQTNITPGSLRAEDIAFYIGPRLNAAGRLDDASISYELLVTDDHGEASVLAEKLESYNTQRRQLTKDMMDDIQQVMVKSNHEDSLIFTAGQEYHPGILGLAASRLVDQYYRPAVVISQKPDGTCRGSARSIPEFNLIQALRQCGDLFIRVGGHPQAAGFDIATDNMDKLRNQLLNIANEELSTVALTPHLMIDAQVPLGTVQGDTFAFVNSLSPFGSGNQDPVFLSRAVAISEARKVGAGGEHLRLVLKGNGMLWNAIAFSQASKWDAGARLVDIVYTVGEDTWRGNTRLQLRIIDFICRD